MQKARVKIGLTGLILFAIVFFVYTPALNNYFVNWDDGSYVYENPHIRSLDVQAVQWMFTSLYAANWHPLTWLSHALDYRFFKLDSRGHHFSSIVLHALNALLAFLLTFVLMLRAKSNTAGLPQWQESLIAAAVTSLLFGLHPLHVESVAWISERKDLLCTFFSLLSLMAYLAYTSSALQKRRTPWLGLSLILMLAALMSKPMAVTLPLILLLLDFYPLQRLETPSARRAVFLEKIPFVVLSALSGSITIIAQRSGEAVRSLEYFPLSGRLIIAIKNVIFYLEKALLPFDLAPFYPLPKAVELADRTYLIPIIIFFSITCLSVIRARQGKPLFLIVGSCYVMTLLPVIGIVQVGHQAAADRYTYLPLLSIFLLAGGGAARLLRTFRWHHQKALFLGVLLSIFFVFACLAALTVKQVRIWHNSESLWTHEISIFPKAVSFPYCSLGNAYLDNRRFNEAIAAYEQALTLEPRDAMAHTNIGVAYERKGMLDEAINKYRDATAANPVYDLPRYNLGNVYEKKGMDEQAILEYRKVLEINPRHAETHNNLGQVYVKKGMFDEAIAAYAQALAVNPYYTDAYTNLGMAYLKKGMAPEAIARFRKAIDLNPRDAKAHGNLCAAYMRHKMFDAAISECKQSISLNPAYATAHYNLGSAYASKGMIEDAVVHFKQAVTLNPQYAMAHYNLGLVYYNKGDYALSLFHYTRAQELGAQVDPEMLALLRSRQ